MPIAVKGHMPFCPPPAASNQPHSSRPINIPRDRRHDSQSKTNSLPILGCERASPLNVNSKSVPILDNDESIHKKDNGNLFKSMLAFFKRKKHSKDKCKSSGNLVDGKITRAELDAFVQAAVRGHTAVQSGVENDDDQGIALPVPSNIRQQRSNSLTLSTSQRTRLTVIREEDERLAPSFPRHRRVHRDRDYMKARPLSDPFDRKSKTYTQYLSLSDSEGSCDSINDVLQLQV